MHVKTQKFLILGASKSGFAVAKYIFDAGGFCSVLEELDTEKAKMAKSKLLEMGVDCISREKADENLSFYDVIVLSPGVPINHEIAVKAKKLGKRIIGELEFGYLQFLPPIIAVTGTNGKTTTVSIINEILNYAGVKNKLVGNVGVPLTLKRDEIDKDCVCVVETSSFQLESVFSFCPHIACILNIAPDHLERHYTMENYEFLKKRIFKNQKESEYTVLNYDDQAVRNFFTETSGKVVWVSTKEKVDGAYLENGKFYFNGEYIVDESELRIKGEHNSYDALFAIVCAKLLNIETNKIRESIKEFNGIKHRIEFVVNKNGVDFYNDSKATNTSSTINAISTMVKPTVLILGGSEKGENYHALFEKIKQSMIKHVILTGASRYSMLDVASKLGVYNVTLTEKFDYSVKIATMFAEDGDCVLLSPACASFDCFSGFEERGDFFVKLVREL